MSENRKTKWFIVDRNDNIVMPRIGKWLAVAAASIFGIICLISGWDTVPPGHRGVAVTMGSVDTEYRSEGFTLKLPMLTSVVPVSIQQQTASTSAACFSADLQTVTVAVTVLYRIPEGRVVELYQQYKGDPYPSLVEPRLHEAIKAAAAKYTADKLVKSREALKVETIDELRKTVGDIITIVDLNLANIDLSDQLEQAIESKMVQEQESLAMAFKLEKANKEAEIQIISAKAEAESVRIKGEALKVASDVIQLEIVKKWNGVSPTTVVVQPGQNTLLPLK